MSRSIKDLGDTQRCPKCGEFGVISELTVDANKVVVNYLCKMCNRNFKSTYSPEEFITMANGFLIDDKKWIQDFQKKYVVASGEFVNLKDGLDGVFVAKNKAAIMEHGKKLLSKCGEFYRMVYKGGKKDTLFFNLKCDNCGGKKLKIKISDFFALGKAGIIPTDTMSIVKEALDADATPWDAGDTYEMPSTMFSSDARSRLGMDDDETLEEIEGITCPKCGAAINIEMRKYGKCATCGNPLSL